jgi:hypothetical protein
MHTIHILTLIVNEILHPSIYIDMAETLLRLAIHRSVEIQLDRILLDLRCQLLCVGA